MGTCKAVTVKVWNRRSLSAGVRRMVPNTPGLAPTSVYSFERTPAFYV
jgi:hypothetical protein